MKNGTAEDPFSSEKDPDTKHPSEEKHSPDSEMEDQAMSEPDSSTENTADSGDGSKPEMEDKDGTADEDEPEGVLGSDMSREDLPYVLRREGVNEGRSMVNMQLRPEVKSRESSFRVDVANEMDLDADDVYAYDLREAMYRVALEHPEEVADKLTEDGYNLL